MQVEGAAKGHLLRAGSSVGQQIFRTTLPCTLTTLNLAGGAIAQAIQVNPTSLIANWASWTNLFQEYAVVGARFRVNVSTAANPAGFTAMFFDEKSVAAPVAGDLSKARLNVSADPNESPSDYILEWKPDDYLDLQWSPTSTTVVPVTIKAWASAATTGTTAATTTQTCLNGELAIDFRGIK